MDNSQRTKNAETAEDCLNRWCDGDESNEKMIQRVTEALNSKDSQISELRTRLKEAEAKIAKLKDCLVPDGTFKTAPIILHSDNMTCSVCGPLKEQLSLALQEVERLKSEAGYHTYKDANDQLKTMLDQALQENEKLKNCVHFEYPDGKDNADYRKENQRLLQSIEVKDKKINEAIKVTMRTSGGAFAERLDETYVILKQALEATSKENP